MYYTFYKIRAILATMGNLKLQFFVIFELFFIVLANGNSCPWDLPDLQLWSDYSTWDGPPPSKGENILVTKNILLDLETPELGTIKIIDGGMIIFSPNHQVKITADSILIMRNGSLIVGNPECIYTPNTEIVLTGDGREQPDTTFGYYTKGIYVGEGGNLDLHGQDKLSWTKLRETLIPGDDGVYEYKIKIVDEPFGWQPRDKLIIASTDYDMNQAEEVEIVNCQIPCDGFCECTVQGDLKYTHYGKIYKNVDMRAEVGLLTRNIKISGDMKNENDTYGGHIKAFYGFETYRAQGIELTKMGQKGIKGRYPFHWHMAKETDPEKTYFKDNAIHDVFQRCVTVHGTHNVNVVNNVAYNTFGHCYFMEDGGEKNNTFHHNLGLGTKRMTESPCERTGGTIPSDRLPSTFWITSPLNVLTENSAAGSEGIGIWYIFSNEVTGPSALEGFYEEGEAFRTSIIKFESNTVHSNEQTGFFFGSEMQPDQDFNGHCGPGGTDAYNPKMDPKDPNSEDASNLIKSLTAFKNREQNTWVDCRRTTYDDYKSADSYLGYTQKHDCDVINSIFIGESDNIGEPNKVILRNKTKVIWHRSTPSEHGTDFIGLQLYDGNPFVSGIQFADFYDDEFKIAGGIGFRKPHAGEPPTIFQKINFDFDDGSQGNYVKGNERFTFGGSGGTERMGQIFDWDGTITGIPKAMIVRDQPFYVSSLCESRPNWGNMSICPHQYVSAEGTGSGYQKTKIVITRDDIPEYPEVSQIYGDPWHPKLSTDHSYLYSFPNNSLPRKPNNFNVKMVGLDSGNSVLVGFCIPLDATADQMRFSGRPKPIELLSYEDLLNEKNGTGYYWDHEVGVVFRRFQVDLPRDPLIRKACPSSPSNQHDTDCPEFRIDTDVQALGDTDCTQRAYPKYRKNPL